MKARLLAFYRTHQASFLIALRVGLSASLAYLAGSLLHLHETFWPVLSAVIVARGGAQGAGGSAKDRLAGTLVGAVVGLVTALLLRLGLPQWVLLFLAMAPMAFLSADKPAFRAAPVAAMIVLSAASTGKGEYYGAGVALMRVLDVGLGTLVAMFVTQILLPSNAVKVMRLDAAALTGPFGTLLALAVRPGDEESRGKFIRLNAKTRRDMRDLVAAARQLGAKGTDEFTQALLRTHGTIVFMMRALGGAPMADDIGTALRPVVGAARAQLDHLRVLLTDGTPVPDESGCGPAVEAARETITRHAADNPAVHLEALPFLLETLRDDLAELIALAAALPGKPQ
jgi:hypothetical protein